MISFSREKCPFVLWSFDFIAKKIEFKKFQDRYEYWCFSDNKIATPFVDARGKQIIKQSGVSLHCIIVSPSDEMQKCTSKLKNKDGSPAFAYKVFGMRVDGKDLNEYLAKSGRHFDNIFVKEE